MRVLYAGAEGKVSESVSCPSLYPRASGTRSHLSSCVSSPAMGLGRRHRGQESLMCHEEKRGASRRRHFLPETLPALTVGHLLYPPPASKFC